MDKLKMQSMDKVQENIRKIQALFPNAVTECADERGGVKRCVDFDVLKQELADTLIDERELRYQFTWPDKQKSVLLANTPTNKTLRPCKEESVDFDSTQNLYIEGDNLEVLKLLQETYLGKIKMIYIDPPYNTGNDFVYNDDFSQEADEYKENSGQLDEQGNRLFQNTESNGRFHTDWLNMIYPRLRLAKDLLSDDGVIYISIDECEITNLKTICNEVFGSKNFVDTLHWKKKKQPSFLAKHTAKVMEYVLVYAKNWESLEKLSIENLSDATKKVVNLTNQFSVRHFKKGVRVKYGTNGVIKKGSYQIKTMSVEYLDDVYFDNGRTINAVDVKAQFSVSQDKIEKYIEDDLLFVTVNYGLRRDVSIEESKERKAITDLLLSEYGDNQESDKEQREIFGEKYFDYSKPIALIKNLTKAVNTQEHLILDFFSGSATTAHAVMQLNAEDGGNRKFVMVQLPEPCDEKSEAYKAGYKNICEIGKERIRRAGAKIKRENGLTAQDLDMGFRVLKLDSSNMKDVYYRPEEYSQSMLEGLADNIKPDRTALDLLFQVMLDLGKPLSAKIEEKNIAGKSVFNVDDGDLVVCFESNITSEIVTEIAKAKPLYAVFRDSGLSSDSVAANFEQIFATYSPNTVRKVL